MQQAQLLSSYLDSGDVINFTIFLRSTFKAMADRKKKRGRWKYKNLNMLRTKRAFQMKQKMFLIVFEGLLFREKQKFHKKIEVTSFNELDEVTTPQEVLKVNKKEARVNDLFSKTTLPEESVAFFQKEAERNYYNEQFLHVVILYSLSFIILNIYLPSEKVL